MALQGNEKRREVIRVIKRDEKRNKMKTYSVFTLDEVSLFSSRGFFLGITLLSSLT